MAVRSCHTVVLPPALINDLSLAVSYCSEDLKPTANGRLLSFKDEDFCLWTFKDKNLPCDEPIEEDFCLSNTVFELVILFRLQKMDWHFRDIS